MSNSFDHRVKTGQVLSGESLPLLVEPMESGLNLIAWAQENREALDQELIANGGLLFRGFELGGIGEFERFIGGLSDEILDYTYRSTPRSEVSGKIYTSTEYPADQSIPMHNEMSYTRSWPRKIWFYSVIVAGEGGETPIADSRRVYQAIDPAVRQQFVDKGGVTYVRNYGGEVDLSWQDVFQTEDRSQVESFCGSAGIELEWLGDDALRTRQVCQAVTQHPETGDDLWFNQAHLFHVSSLGPVVREFLEEEYGVEGLPRNTFFGDGSPIDDEILDHIREVYEQTRVVFPWQEGDVLMLDNMLVAHGRNPYGGDRKLVVGMAESYSV